MTERKAFTLFFLLILALFMVGFALDLMVEAQEYVPEPQCPVYAPNCWLYLGEFDEPTVVFNPTVEPIDWSGEHMVTLGQYRIFSTSNTLVCVDTETGFIALWLEVNYGLAPGQEHILLGDNGIISVWLLTTGEWQVEVKQEGVIKVMIFAGLPIVEPQYSEKLG